MTTTQEFTDLLRDVFPAGSTVYTVLRHVSRSGMTRVVSVHARPGEDDWSIAVATVLDRSVRNSKLGNGVQCHGFGTNVGFELAYHLGIALYGDASALNHRWV